jgi:plasmid stabilization system protein ParE
VARFILSEQAVTDVDVIDAYICADNPNAADRVEEAIFEGFDLLARNPGLGRLRHFRRHKNIRSWVVTEFSRYLIFYRELADGSGVENPPRPPRRTRSRCTVRKMRPF